MLNKYSVSLFFLSVMLVVTLFYSYSLSDKQNAKSFADNSDVLTNSTEKESDSSTLSTLEISSVSVSKPDKSTSSTEIDNQEAESPSARQDRVEKQEQQNSHSTFLKRSPLFPREDAGKTKKEVIHLIAESPLEEVISQLNTTSDGRIPYPYFRTAAMKGRLDLLKYMLQHTAVNDQRQLNDLLQYSANSANIEVVSYLLELGASDKVSKPALVGRAIRTSRDLEFTLKLIDMGFTIDKSSAEEIKQKSWVKPESKKIIEELERRGLL